MEERRGDIACGEVHILRRVSHDSSLCNFCVYFAVVSGAVHKWSDGVPGSDDSRKA